MTPDYYLAITERDGRLYFDAFVDFEAFCLFLMPMSGFEMVECIGLNGILCEIWKCSVG